MIRDYQKYYMRTVKSLKKEEGRKGGRKEGRGRFF
jgi:hypothetical protein